MKLKFISLLFLFGLAACHSSKKTEATKTASTPECISSMVITFKTNVCPNTATVKEYIFQKKTVYVFNRGTCGADMSMDVMDEKCRSLGHLGGIAGVTKINGEEFSKAIFVRIVWENKLVEDK